MNRPTSAVPLHRAFRRAAFSGDTKATILVPTHIFRIPSARETGEAVKPQAASSVTYDPLGDEQPDAIHWPSFFAGIILGLAGGLLAIALPAIVLARVLFGVWF